MTDREQVIKELTNLPTTIYDGFYQLRITHDLRNKVIALLKDREPVEVLHHEAPYGYPFNTGKCPICFQELDEGDNFCRSCGQEVKWE